MEDFIRKVAEGSGLTFDRVLAAVADAIFFADGLAYKNAPAVAALRRGDSVYLKFLVHWAPDRTWEALRDAGPNAEDGWIRISIEQARALLDKPLP